MQKKILFITTLWASQASAQVKFVEFPAPFSGVEHSSIAFADIDGDSDQDLVITGDNAPTKLYTNNGSGSFTAVFNPPFDDVALSSIAFADIDGDTDQDLMITGFINSNLNVSKLYRNNGSGSFTEITGTPFPGVKESSIAFADIDGDTDLDLMLTGEVNANQKIAKLYRNNGSGVYTEILNNPFVGVDISSVAFADVDGDSDQDLVITGFTSSQYISKLYTNNGSGSFTEVIGTPFTRVGFSSVAFSDVDGDTDQDLIIAGHTISGRICKLYQNNGSGVFTEVTGTPFLGIQNGSVTFEDVDGNGYEDLFITGYHLSQSPSISKLYLNNGGTFTEDLNNSFPGVMNSSVAFADANGDSRPDLVITGRNGSSSIAKYYRSCVPTTGTDVQMACESYTWTNGMTYYSNNNTARDTLTNVGGCDSIVTLNLTITQSTTATDIQTACGSFMWLDGITYTSNNNTATDTLTNAVGCDSIVTLNLTITQVDTSTTVSGMTITAHSATATTYQWIDCNNQGSPIAGATASSYTATSGNYAVIITEVSGCTDTSKCHSIVPLSIEQQVQSESLIVYPNPIIGNTITIEYAGDVQKLSLVDMMGKIITTQTAVSNSGVYQIDSSDLQPGVYIILILTPNGTIHKQVVVK